MTEEQAISQKRVEYALTHLPSLEKLETPPSVRNAAWYQEAGLEGKVELWPWRGDRIDKFSGKLPGVVENFKGFERRGLFKTRPTLVVPSSGNFGKDAGGVARGYNVEKVIVDLPAGVPEGKRKQIEANGVTVEEAPKGMSTIQYAYQLASEVPNRIVMNQYIEDDTVVGHGRMMEHIGAETKRLGWDGETILIVGVTGTCATLTAARRYLPKFVTGPVKILAVASHSKEEKVPASRSPEDYEELRDINGSCGFMFREEWKGVIDFPIVTDVMRDQAYAMNGELFRYNYSVGPAGALATAGAYSFLKKCHESGESKRMLPWLRKIVLIWMDAFYAYDDPKYRESLRA